MEIVAFIVIGIFIFCMGWATGNLVEWSMTYRERRLNEEKIANLMNEMYRKEKQDRG
jgi:hypothetical protein